MKKVLLTICCVLLSASFALADWNEGEPCKMHYPQLPDPNGIDVNFMDPKVLADDFLCTQSGPITDVHFWFSSKQDEDFQIDQIHVSIHSDDRSGPFSKPGNLLWEYDFLPFQFSVRWYGEGQQGWYDPNEQIYTPNDHVNIWQCNIVNIPEPFYQQQGTIYWLDLSLKATNLSEPGAPAHLGWKTSKSEHFEDDAVWGDYPCPDWQELKHPETGESLDLAFVITPEPTTIGLLLFGLAGLIRRRS